MNTNVHMHAPMLSRCVMVLASLYSLGCSDHPVAPKGAPPEEAYRIDRTNLGDDGWEIANSFENFDKIAASLKNADEFKVYEGLPHDVWESELYESELKNAKTIEIAGTPFYEEPVAISDHDSFRLRGLSSSRNSFVPFRGFKGCVGFHPDWCLVWEESGTTYAAKLCFGCHELIVSEGAERVLYCDIWDCPQFMHLLKPLRTNRPDEKFD